MTLVRFHRYRPAALLVVAGEDATAFLQGQFSNDLRGDAPRATYGFWLNAKGKIEADSHVLNRRDGSYWILSHGCAAAAIQRRLEAFIVADDVTVVDRTNEAAGVWWWGDGVAAVAAGFGLAGGGAALSDAGAAVAFRGPSCAGDWVGWCGLGLEKPVAGPSSGQEADGAALAHARHVLRWPSVPTEAKPGDLPQEAGLDRVGVSLRKGCYVGQEVMARLDSMGKVRRTLVLVRAQGAAPMVPAVVGDGSRVVGELRSAVPDGDGFVGFAMVQGGEARVRAGGLILDDDRRELALVAP